MGGGSALPPHFEDPLELLVFLVKKYETRIGCVELSELFKNVIRIDFWIIFRVFLVGFCPASVLQKSKIALEQIT